jgi:hypothetical protein
MAAINVGVFHLELLGAIFDPHYSRFIFRKNKSIILVQILTLDADFGFTFARSFDYFKFGGRILIFTEWLGTFDYFKELPLDL